MAVTLLAMVMVKVKGQHRVLVWAAMEAPVKAREVATQTLMKLLVGLFKKLKVLCGMWLLRQLPLGEEVNH